MPDHVSYIDRLLEELDLIEKKMVELIGSSSIKTWRPTPGIVIVAPKYYWSDADGRQKVLQMEVKEAYSTWYEHLDLLFQHTSDTVDQDFRV